MMYMSLLPPLPFLMACFKRSLLEGAANLLEMTRRRFYPPGLLQISIGMYQLWIGKLLLLFDQAMVNHIILGDLVVSVGYFISLSPHKPDPWYHFTSPTYFSKSTLSDLVLWPKVSS